MPEVTVEILARGSSAVAELPFDPREQFGQVRAPVCVTVNGHTFRTTTMRYGGIEYIGFNRQVRERAAIAPGDRVTLTVEHDREQRIVTVPDDLADALRSAPDASRAFDGLSYTHRKEYVRWVDDAKRDATRRTRIEKTVAMLCSGIKHP